MAEIKPTVYISFKTSLFLKRQEEVVAMQEASLNSKRDTDPSQLRALGVIIFLLCHLSASNIAATTYMQGGGGGGGGYVLGGGHLKAYPGGLQGIIEACPGGVEQHRSSE